MMRLILCATCGAELTPPLEDVAPGFGPFFSLNRDVVSRGRLWLADATHAADDMPEGSAVANLDDAQTVPLGLREGCCGVSSNGPNLACRAGHAVGTERSDCLTFRFVCFDPAHTIVAPTSGTDAQRIVFIGHGRGDEMRLRMQLNAEFELGEWGGDLEALFDAVALVAGRPVELIWARANRSRQAGINVEEQAARLQRSGAVVTIVAG